MKLAGKTDVGRVRQENQDDYRAGELPGGAVWALVCDGMGGAKGGREASQGACNVIENFFQEQYAQCGVGQEEPFLKKALLYATVVAGMTIEGFALEAFDAVDRNVVDARVEKFRDALVC